MRITRRKHDTVPTLFEGQIQPARQIKRARESALRDEDVYDVLLQRLEVAVSGDAPRPEIFERSDDGRVTRRTGTTRPDGWLDGVGGGLREFART